MIGGGVGGLRAALEAAQTGNVLLLTKSHLSESNTFYAQGGIATALAPEDSFASHIADTLAAGCGLCDPDAVSTVVTEAPARIQELIAWAPNFDREIGGGLSFTREGGHAHARIVHALGDATGRELANCLANRVRSTERIQLLEHTFVLDLLTVDGVCLGAIAWQRPRRRRTRRTRRPLHDPRPPDPPRLRRRRRPLPRNHQPLRRHRRRPRHGLPRRRRPPRYGNGPVPSHLFYIGVRIDLPISSECKLILP